MPKLFVFEGPDNVGKTTLSKAVEQALNASGVPCVRLSFPGDEPGTLGSLVRDLHHQVTPWASMEIAPAALQLMHVAAHLDVIERRVLPLLSAGTTVLLDRFWWSTYVYGQASGIPAAVLRLMLDVEESAWNGIRPAVIFLVERRSEDVDRTLVDRYAALAAEERRSPVLCLNNNRDIGAAVDDAVDAIDRVNRSAQLRLQTTTETEVSQNGRAEARMPLFFSTLSPAKPSQVYDTYWRFATERQDIFYRRVHGHRTRLTSDPILSQHKFTNAYRASDRVSQYLIRHVIYDGEQSAEEIFFRTLLFKLFNKVETWRLLRASLGEVAWRSYDFRRYDAVLNAALAAGERIYSAAYIMPAARGFGDDRRKHRTHLQLLESMIQDGAPARVAAARNLRQVFEILKRYPMMGDFLAFQFAIDLNYSVLLDFSEMEFIVPGPGARDGIRKCFSDYGGLTESDLIRVVAERQDAEFERLGLSFKSLWGRPLQLIDCQNLFCETDKYARLAHPDVPGISGRTRIKQIYRPSVEPLEYWYPPKWKLNEAIAADYASHLASQD